MSDYDYSDPRSVATELERQTCNVPTKIGNVMTDASTLLRNQYRTIAVLQEQISELEHNLETNLNAANLAAMTVRENARNNAPRFKIGDFVVCKAQSLAAKKLGMSMTLQILCMRETTDDIAMSRSYFCRPSSAMAIGKCIELHEIELDPLPPAD